MGKILVTGATGRLGSAVVHGLVQRGDAADVVGLARDQGKAQPLTALGIEVRYGDYTDYDALVRAFQGVETIYMVSAVAFSDRIAQHKNVIDAARRAGVGHVMYTAIQRVDDVLGPIEGVTDSDIATEHLLKQSGLGYTVLRHPLYANDLPLFSAPMRPTPASQRPPATAELLSPVIKSWLKPVPSCSGKAPMNIAVICSTAAVPGPSLTSPTHCPG
jgi:NAD(P)H dehydrogenase (quinone)